MTSCAAAKSTAPLLAWFLPRPTTNINVSLFPSCYLQWQQWQQNHKNHLHHQQTRGLRLSTAQQPKPILTKKGDMVVTQTIEKMPFQMYQLALELINQDRREKLQEIKKTREKIKTTLAVPDADPNSTRILNLKRHLERLKILADINNPRVKYNFENGIIGLNKPIYRYLLDRKWRSYARPILMQRLTQMRVIPDILPTINPIVDVQVRFRGYGVKPGTILNSLRTELPPSVKIVSFTADPRLCTIAVVDPDVPNLEKDTYMYRLHWLVCNIKVSNKNSQAIGYPAERSDLIVPWLPPHVQKGINYHRYGLFVFEQSNPIDTEVAQKSFLDAEGNLKRDKFILRSFQSKHQLSPIGAFMWRNEWDEHTKEVMGRHGLEGADIMWQRVKA